MADAAYVDYCRDHLPAAVVERLEAAAFRSLCTHLQERSDAVQNIDLMTVGGFCRNCLAKWMVIEARKLVDSNQVTDPSVIHSLNAVGYDQAAEHVYGMTYSEWKKRHQQKATDEQMEKYNASEPIQAKHDKKLLEPRASITKDSGSTSQIQEKPILLSNVCCEDVEEVAQSSLVGDKSTSACSLQPPAIQVRVGVLTVSDRAANNEYVTGDLSGPAVENEIKKMAKGDAIITLAVVPDKEDAIKSQLKAWSEDGLDVILTTGGTGFSPRDVTPEATRAVLDQECQGLISFVVLECSKAQPLSSLSRGTAGLIGNTMVANLPGNPVAVSEMMPLLFPLLLHAVADLRAI